MPIDTQTIDTELETQGTYGFTGTWYGAPYETVTKLNAPLTPRENMFRYLSGGEYYWVPDAGRDQVDLTPENIPDVVACGYEGGLDTFGVKWVPLDNGLPAMVEPGKPLLKDIAGWRTLKWPDVSAWPWEEYGKAYQDAFGKERFTRGIILSGFFERLISLMDFEEAAVALIAEPEEVNTFFDKLADLNIEIIEHYKKYFDVDGIMFHDDWGSQRSPFFSLETVRATIVPPLKKVIERAHELDLYFTFHSCGDCQSLVPAMIEAGADSWQFQENSIDYQEMLARYGEQIMLEGYWEIPFDASDEEVKKQMSSILQTLGAQGRGFCSFYDYNENRSFDPRSYIYSEARKLGVQ